MTREMNALSLVFFIVSRRRASLNTVLPSNSMSEMRTRSPSSTVNTTFFSLGATSVTAYCAVAKRYPFSPYISSISALTRCSSPSDSGSPSWTRMRWVVSLSWRSVFEIRFSP